MKTKLSLILMLLTISLIGICQQKVKFTGVFETGYESRTTTIYLGQLYDYLGLVPKYEVKPFYGFFCFDMQYKGFKIFSSNKTFFNKDKPIYAEERSTPYFRPLLTEFKVGLSYSHGRISGGYEHLCSHNISERIFTELYDRIYIRITINN
jgi:hypothetical protein